MNFNDFQKNVYDTILIIKAIYTVHELYMIVYALWNMYYIRIKFGRKQSKILAVFPKNYREWVCKIIKKTCVLFRFVNFSSFLKYIAFLIRKSPQDFPGGSDGKASVYNVRDLSSIPGLGRFPGEGNGNPLQYSCLENPMDRGAWCRLLSMGLQRVGHN